MSNNPATVIRFKCRCVLICVKIYIWDPFLPTKPLQTRTEEKTNKEIDHFKSQNVFGRKLLAVLIEEPICHTKAETIGFLGFWYCFIYCNQAVLKEQGLTEMKNSFELLNCAFMCQDCFFSRSSPTWNCIINFDLQMLLPKWVKQQWVQGVCLCL